MTNDSQIKKLRNYETRNLQTISVASRKLKKKKTVERRRMVAMADELKAEIWWRREAEE